MGRSSSVLINRSRRDLSSKAILFNRAGNSSFFIGSSRLLFKVTRSMPDSKRDGRKSCKKKYALADHPESYLAHALLENILYGCRSKCSKA
ncbi:hypothetical protein PENTCL1PPCAC_4130 [Pristionchus entomophagus]|uniref:Ribosomal protein n=1 Tax=Pristionchus entomophagus TaxID=358040 RepID=A0AAV5SP83_9BILA|nr:hypothetical protein PENTCL1PPCAC_4130 [Pristionchus entomophagus]